jgi:hypothetical protein
MYKVKADVKQREACSGTAKKFCHGVTISLTHAHVRRNVAPINDQSQKFNATLRQHFYQ